MIGQNWIGTPVKRIEDPRFLTGRGRFTDDVRLPGMLYAAILRSPYGHAKIRKIDTSQAEKMPGVVAVLAGEEARKITRPIDFPPTTVPGSKFQSVPFYCLPIDKVYYDGQPVAAVAAESLNDAVDALDEIEVEYEPLPAVVDAERAMLPNAPLIYDGWKSNIALDWEVGGGDTEKAFREADFVISEKLVIQRYTGTPIEPRAYVASFESGTNSLTLWASTQAPTQIKINLSFALPIDESRIRVISPDVGGAFGNKHPMYPEEFIVPILSMKTGRPVRWCATRSEDMRSLHHGRQITHYVEVAAKNNGTILGIRDKMIADLGACTPTAGPTSTQVAAIYTPGVYKIRNCSVHLYGVATNKVPYGAFRAFGKDAANFAYERMIEQVAKKLHMDPAEVRFKNFIQPEDFPYYTSTGAVYDSGNYPKCLQKLLEASDYEKLREEQRKLRAEGRYVGIGISYMLEPSGQAMKDHVYTGFDSATIKVSISGKVTVLPGVESPGTGHETTFAQIVSEILGLDINNIAVIEGDTSLCPYGLGSWSSRGSVVGTSSVALAAEKMKLKMVKIAANLLEARPDDLEMKDGRIYAKDLPSIGVTISDVTRVAYTQPYLLPEGEDPALEVTASYVTKNVRYEPDELGRINMYPNYPNGAFLFMVEVDPEVGSIKILKSVIVHDCGKIINPLIVEGQVHGAVAHGIGGAIHEELVYNKEGTLLSSTFMDYLVPTAADIPSMEIHHEETPSPYTTLGTKGAGEGGTCGTPSALANAVEDALSPLGVKITELPLSPEKIYSAVKATR